MKRKLMLLLACLFVGISLVTAQTQKVTGVVISEEDGQPVVGASVLVKGTKFCKDFADFVYWYANTRSRNQTYFESFVKV